jgi:hypothetical protein
MRSRTFIIVAAGLAALVLGAGALYAYDASLRDDVADGVHVGGVDVSGLGRAQARAKLSRVLGDRLARPIVVRYGRVAFRLTPARAGARFDVRGMVDAAIARSREGSIFTRTWRNLRGASLHAELPAQVTYSRRVLARFIGRVEGRLDRKPSDAHLDFGDGTFTKVAGKPGVTIDSRALHNQLAAAIVGTRSATIAVSSHRVRPRVTIANLAREYPTLILISRDRFELWLYKRLRLAKTYPIAVGQIGYATAAGVYHIQDKTVDPTWEVPNAPWAGSLAGQVIPGGAPDNPLKARWLGFFNGAGIHGTADDSSVGSAASHGCIRMHIPDVIDLYDRVPLGTPLYIS